MTRYAVGDLQGCLQPLKCLLQDVDFDPQQDQLWLVGDLINRGPESLQTLRYIKQLGSSTRIVLGNHDLHFLAVAYGAAAAGKSDTFDELLAAEDREELVAWLLQHPLLYSDPSGDFHMAHAGIPPMWSIAQARDYAHEVETVLHNGDALRFFEHMYGNQPAQWDEQLTGWVRLRVICNYFTRMRFCTADGELDLKHKLASIEEPGFEHFLPWFAHSNRRTREDKIVFGHWASLQGEARGAKVFALDSGCVWGRSMTLMNLDTEQLHHCQCRQI